MNDLGALLFVLLAQSPAPTPTPLPSAPPPPATDVYLMPVSVRGGRLVATSPVRVTDRAGYDNQPAFSPDGRSLFFTRIEAGHATIARYDLASRAITAVTSSPESDYSPTPAPGGGLSVVRVEKDGTQRLWHLPEGGAAPQPILPGVKGVGYHAWADPDTLVLFVLGSPPTLQVADRRSGRAEVVVTDIGRGLRPVPGRAAVSFVRKLSLTEWWLEVLELPSRRIERLARLPEGVEDHAWLPGGRVVIGQGPRILELPPGAREFREVIRFEDPALQALTRMAASPAGDLLALVSEEAPRGPLTVDEIMRGPELVGHAPSALRWSGDSRDLFFEWRQPGEDEAATWVVSRGGAEPRRLSDAERKDAPGPSCEWDAARRRCLFVADGDIVLVDTVARTRRQVTRTTAPEGTPRFTSGDRQVTFVRENNLYRSDLAAGGDVLVQLTDVGPRKKEPKLTPSQAFLKEEERRLLKKVDRIAARKKREEERKEQEGPPRFEISDKQAVPQALLSGDGRYAFLIVTERASAARTADVPNYVTESSYTETIATRTRVGDRQERRRLAVLDLVERKRVWVYVEGVTLPVEEKKPEAEEEDEKKEDEKAEDEAAKRKDAGREVRFRLPVLSPNGSRAVALVEAADSKDRYIVLVDPATGRGRPLEALHDDAWVREASTRALGWVDERTVWFLSERSGFQHLYTVDVETAGASPRALTAGRFEVTEAELLPSRAAFLVTTNEADPGERHVYRLPATGGALVRLTSRTGAHSLTLSPDEATSADVFSDARTPPEVYLADNRAGAVPRQVTMSTSGAFRARAWLVPPVITFPARDGAKVPARLYTPAAVGASAHPSKPAVVFIHGAGYLQNAHRYWSQYFREYLFHHLLAARGYVVLDIDYRGSAGYGRDWRTAIATHMGGKDLDDAVDAAKFLAETHGVDPGRIGIYGGSYGGFITLMAMFTRPGTFAAGAALRPVTDWAHYNHPYTSDILGTPPKDAEAYRRSSPIHFAEGLQGALLICHGMVDTNVHFQDSVRLAQRLIELRKENWELAVYPVENHGFEEATSWADEYKRILRLFEQTLKR